LPFRPVACIFSENHQITKSLNHQILKGEDMASPASVRKHPIHPMLITFPVALWIFSLFADAMVLLGWGSPIWSNVAFYSMVGGLIGALAAALPGYLDYRSLTSLPAATIAWWHMVINLTIVTLYVINLLIRLSSEPGALFPMILSLLGVGLLGISGWLGGELVYVQGIAVEPSSRNPTVRRDRVA
jgi:uncharacterized membrane protein